MSGERIPVSGNGHGPRLEATPAAGPPAAAPPAAQPAPVPDVITPDAPFASRPGLAVNATPGQLAVGFGIVASLVLLALGVRRRR